MAILFILLFVLIILGIYGIWFADKIEEPLLNIVPAIVFIMCGGIIDNIVDYNTPQAIDVYRNKTTLEITYKDSIPVDTVVVFNDKLQN